MTSDWGEAFHSAGLVVGVPDSLLAPLLSLIPADANHLASVNEGSAVAAAAGFALGSDSIPIVYMQNSGLGNAINPLISLASSRVYRVPMVLVIGWRGETDESGFSTQDEPQHNSMGEISLKLLDLLSLNTKVCDQDVPVSPQVLKEAMNLAKKEGSPVALLVRKSGMVLAARDASSFEPRESEVPSRRDYLEELAGLEDTFFIATTGHIAREMYSLCTDRGSPSRLLMVTGAMGHMTSIACGLALANPSKRFIAIDGDGSFLMHMGAITGLNRVNNLSYVGLNNDGHGSVGGQPTAVASLDMSAAIAGITGIQVTATSTLRHFADCISKPRFFVECKTNFVTSPKLPRPTETHFDMAQRFKEALLEQGND